MKFDYHFFKLITLLEPVFNDLQSIARENNLPLAELILTRRPARKSLVSARHEAFRFLHQHGWSCEQIGDFFRYSNAAVWAVVVRGARE